MGNIENIAIHLTEIDTAKSDIKAALEEKEIDMTDVPFTDYHEKLAEIKTYNTSGIGEIFTGYTMPIMYKLGEGDDDTHRTIEWNSGGYKLTITGLADYGTMKDNGTNHVEFECSHNGSDDLIILFEIKAESDSNEFIYRGRMFYYGKEVDEGKCLTLAVKHMPQNDETGDFIDNWTMIESSTFPVAVYGTDKWNDILLPDIVSFNIGKNKLTSAPTYSFRNCYALNQPLFFPDIKNMGTYSLSFLRALNQPLSFPVLETTGSYCLYGMVSFNQPITFPLLEEVVSYFFATNSAFNQLVSFPKLKKVGNYFFGSNFAFNYPLSLPEIKTIGTHFLTTNYAFNQDLFFPVLEKISSDFLSNCRFFGGVFHFPLIEEIDAFFCYNCLSLTRVVWSVDVFPAESGSFSGDDAYSRGGLEGMGIKITGTYAAQLKAALPDSPIEPYRKLVL